VLIHGMWGSGYDLASIEEELKTHLKETATNEHGRQEILLSQVNHRTRTYHGIDICGHRLAMEIKERLLELQTEEEQQLVGQECEEQGSTTTTTTTSTSSSSSRSRRGRGLWKLTLVGYSAGGLFARYAVAVLMHQGVLLPPGGWEKRCGSGVCVEACQLVTIATPHLGCRNSHRRVEGRLLNGLARNMANLYCGRSGDQLFLLDRGGDPAEVHQDGAKKAGLQRATSQANIYGVKPLLLKMSEPGSIFMRALALFRVTVYANALKDHTVPYCTAAITLKNPYRERCGPESELQAVDGHRFVVREEVCSPPPARVADVVVLLGGVADPSGGMEGDHRGGEEEASSPPETTGASFDGELDEVAGAEPVPAPVPQQAAASEAALTRWQLVKATVAAGILCPLALTHATLLASPVRFLSGGPSQEDMDEVRKSFSSRRTSLSTQSNCSEESNDDEPSSSTHSMTNGDLDMEREKVEAAMDRKDVEGYQEGIDQELEAAEDSADDEEDEERDEVFVLDLLPQRIHSNILGSLTFTRVDCCLPGKHTHGRIIARRKWKVYSEGMDVIKHLMKTISLKV